MKKLLFVVIFVLSFLGATAKPHTLTDIPNVQLQDSRRYTSNPDGVLSREAVYRLDTLCASLRRRALAQPAIVVVNEIEGDDVFTFAYNLFSKWGVGREKRDNGLGILLVTDRREVRIVTGYGLEGVLTDALCRRIIERYMIPEFRTGDYGAGLLAGMTAINELLSGSELDLSNTGNPFANLLSQDKRLIWTALILIGLVLLRVWLFIRKRRNGGGGHSGMGGFLAGMLGGMLMSGRGGGFGGGSRGGGFGGGGAGGKW